MHLINGKPWVDLEPYLDIKGLEAIKKDIVVGMVKSKLDWQVGSSGNDNLYNNIPSSIVNQAWPHILNNPAHPDYAQFKELKFDMTACLEYLKFMYKFQDMGELLSLRTFKKAGDIIYKFSAEHTFDTPAYNNFPALRKWINECKAFDSIGRVLFWRSQAHEPGAIHKDTYLGSPDTFVLINLDLDRKVLFLLDDDGKEVPITSKAFIFDPRTYHGTRGLDHAGWTLRIDGKFNQDWVTQVGIENYLKSTS